MSTRANKMIAANSRVGSLSATRDSKLRFDRPYGIEPPPSSILTISILQRTRPHPLCDFLGDAPQPTRQPLLLTHNGMLVRIGAQTFLR